MSNKNSDVSETQGDALETLLYAVFVATSERASVAQLASILSVPLSDLQAALSVACRLGFASLVAGGDAGGDAGPALELGIDVEGGYVGAMGGEKRNGCACYATPATHNLPCIPRAMHTACHVHQPHINVTHTNGQRSTHSMEAPDVESGVQHGPQGAGVALVVDSEVTGYLMMGALSPGLKKHSVTLFEGGRITGTDAIAELQEELLVSVEAADAFEGEMRHLACYARCATRSCLFVCLFVCFVFNVLPVATTVYVQHMT